MAAHRKNAGDEAGHDSTISIELETTDVTAGETLRGQVKLSIKEHMPARGVRLVLRGHETSIRHSGMGRSMKQEQEIAVWFEEELTLFGQPSIHGAALLGDAVKGIFSKEHYPTIEPGDYAYDFEYQLPDRLPGDYESTLGDVAIRYSLRAYVDIPLRVDLQAMQGLTVYETARHDDDADVARVSVDKKCPLHRNGHVVLRASIDHRAYKLGQEIQLSVNIDNHCDELVDGLIIGLTQTETVVVHGETETRDVVLANQTFDNCKAAPGEKEAYQLSYTIAPELYPSVEVGRLVNVAYAVRIEANVYAGLNPSIEVPIRLYETPGEPGGQSS